MPSQKSIPHTDLDWLTYYESLSKTGRRIVKYLHFFYAKNKAGYEMPIYPGHAHIAKKCECDIRTVLRFMKKHRLKLFDWRSGKIDWTSNKYFLNKYFFEFIWKMKGLGLLTLWDKCLSRLTMPQKKMRFDITWSIAQSDTYLIERMNNLSTKKSPKCRTEKSPKCRTTKDLTPSTFPSDKYVHRDDRASYEQPKKEEEAFGGLDKIPMSYKDRKLISHAFAYFARRQAIEDFTWYSKTHVVGNPAGFIWDRAKQHTIRKLKINI